MKIGIIGAMSVEVEALKKCMTDAKKSVCGHLEIFEGKIYGTDCAVVQCGVGKVNAGVCAEILIIKYNVTHIINSGVGGGLQKGLNVMDIVVSTDAVQYDVDATGFGYALCEIPGMGTVSYKADESLVRLAEAVYADGLKNGEVSHRIIAGRIGTADIFVNSREKKAEITALCGAACCEMEGAAIAQICTLNKIPFVIIRCISDLAEDTDQVYEEAAAAKESIYLTENLVKRMGK